MRFDGKVAMACLSLSSEHLTAHLRSEPAEDDAVLVRRPDRRLLESPAS
jgi:hypothetical protein